MNHNNDNFILNLGDEVASKKGQITNVKTGQLESRSFGETYEYDFEDDVDFFNFCKQFKNPVFTHCFEGPLIKFWYDSYGVKHLSSQKNIDCMSSYWGDKTKRFGELFYKYGGKTFEEHVDKKPNLTHHFMIIEPSLMVTTRVDIFDNECVLVYLGTVDLEGNKFNIDYDPEVFCECKSFMYKEFMKNRILYPKPIIFEEALDMVKDKKDRPYKKENVMLIDDRKIYKIKHTNYTLRELLAGSCPNLKYRMYVLLDDAKKDFVDYSEQFPVIGTPSDSELNLFLEMNSDTIENYVHNSVTKHLNTELIMTDIELKKRNILLVLILNLPLEKSKQVIKYWFEYSEAKNKIANTIIKLNRQTDNFTKLECDEVLVSFNKLGIDRLTDLSKTCKNYARTSTNNKPFMYNLKFSLYGLLNREYGSSLYRIEKCLEQLKL